MASVPALFEEPGEPAVLEDPPARLLLGAVAWSRARRSGPPPASRRSAGTARPRGGGPAAASASCRARRRRSPPRSGRSRRRARAARRGGARPPRRRAPSPARNGDSAASQSTSSTQERPIPAITRWSRSIGWRWRGWATARASSSSGGAGQASGPSVATISSASTSPAGISFAQARCLVPNSRRRSSRPSASRTSTREARSRSDARLSKTWRRPADIRWTSIASGSSSAAGELDHGHLPDAPDAGDPAALERREGRVDRLQRDHAGRERRLDLGVPQAPRPTGGR